MAAILLKLIKEYGFKGNIGYFMGDNAESNDTCVNAVLRVLYPKMSAKKRKACWLRCFGHIINLCAQAFIIGKDAEKICKEMASVYYEMDFKRVQELWKKWGSIRLLYNLIQYIRMTPQRRGFFKSIKIRGDLAKYDC